MTELTVEKLKEILGMDESLNVSFRKTARPDIVNVVVSLANACGGYVIIGHSKKNGVVGVRPNTIEHVKDYLKKYSKLVRCYEKTIEGKTLLIIEVEQSQNIVENAGVIYYRENDGTINSMDPKTNLVLAKTFLESMRYIPVKEIMKKTGTGEKTVRNWIAHNESIGRVFSKKIGNTFYYSYKKDAADPCLMENSLERITTSDELIAYLKTRAKQVKSTKLLHQYTTIDAVSSILQKGEFYVGLPENMNDVNEYENFGNGARGHFWDGVYITCFMEDDSESIAMWSQYAQPWECGVRLSISAKALKKWIEHITKVYAADEHKNSIKEKEYVDGTFQKSFYKVAYTNEEDYLARGVEEVMCVGEQQNYIMKELYQKRSLCGFVKNSAWSYEKEIRLRIDIPSMIGVSDKKKLKGIVIPIPEDIISCFQVMKGPRVGDKDPKWIKLQTILDSKGIRYSDRSIFEDKLKNLACDRCSYKKTKKAMNSKS